MAVVTDEWGFTEKLANDSEQTRKYHKCALEALRHSMDLYGDGQWGGEWKLNAEDKESGDKVYVKKTDTFGNVFALVCKIKASPDAIFQLAWNRIDEMSKWNPNIKEYKLLTEIGDQTQIVLNASEALLGGLVSSRDFVNIRIWRKLNDAFVLAARAVDYDPMPPQKGYVRGDEKIGLYRIGSDGSGGCEVVWLSSMDLKGMLPKSVVERAKNGFMLDYARYLKKAVQSA